MLPFILKKQFGCNFSSFSDNLLFFFSFIPGKNFFSSFTSTQCHAMQVPSKNAHRFNQ